MLFTITELSLRITIYAIEKLYNTGYYFIYGSPQSELEILRKEFQKLNEKLDRLEHSNSIKS